MDKYTHEDCRYRPAEDKACANCRHFTGQNCRIVEDPISPDMLCDFHVSAGTATPQVRNAEAQQVALRIGRQAY